MKVVNPLHCLQCTGTLAKTLIFRRTRQGHTVYTRFSVTQPNTPAQQNHHILFRRLAQRWQTLDQAARDCWGPPAETAKISPYNAYLGYNLVRLNADQPADLVAWWTNLVPAGSILHDLGPGQHDAEFVDLPPGPAWTYDIHRGGKVIEFTPPGYVNVPTPPQLGKPFTIAAWMKQNTYTHNCALIDTGVVTNYCFGQIRYERLAGVLANYFVTTDPIWLTAFDWHHVAFCWDGNQLNLWIDGIPVTGTASNTPPAAQTQMWIARRGVETAGETFHGRLDDLRLYSRILSTADVLELAAR